MDRQIEWFCYHITTEGLVTAEQCHGVARAFAETGVEPDLDAFAQAIFDKGLCADTERLEKLGTLAIQEAETLGSPPVDALGSSGGGRPRLALKMSPPCQETALGAAPLTPSVNRTAETVPAPADGFVPPGSGFPVAGWILFVLMVVLIPIPSEVASGAFGLLFFISLVMVFIDNRRLGFGRMYREVMQWDVELPLGWFSRQLAHYPTVACWLAWIPFFPIYLARRCRIARVLHETVMAGREHCVKRKPMSSGEALWATTCGVLKVLAAVVLVVAVIGAISVVQDSRSSPRKSPSKACAQNLMLIDFAKAQWAPTGKSSGGVDLAGVSLYIEGGLSSLKCPGGGTYSVNDLGVLPSCSISEHTQAYIALDQQSWCVICLTKIDSAKAKWAAGSGKRPGASATRAELLPFIEFSEEDMKCPSGGKYTANPVGTLAQCSFDAHTQAYRKRCEQGSGTMSTGGSERIAAVETARDELRRRVPPTAKEFKGNSYLAVLEKTTWKEAKSACETALGHLVTIGDEGEDRFVDGLIPRQDKVALWIGCTDEKTDGEWLWVDGSSVRQFSGWAPGLVNPDLKGGENYGVWGMWDGKRGWNDVLVDNPEVVGYVCEWETAESSQDARGETTEAGGLPRSPAQPAQTGSVERGGEGTTTTIGGWFAGLFGGGSETAAKSFMETWVSSASQAAATMDARCEESAKEVVTTMELKSFDGRIRSKGEATWTKFSTGAQYRVDTFLVTPVVNFGGTFLPTEIEISVCKDSKKVLVAKPDL